MTISSRPHNKARLSTMELIILVVSASGYSQHLFIPRIGATSFFFSLALDDSLHCVHASATGIWARSERADSAD
jgi:hypothetical protein